MVNGMQQEKSGWGVTFKRIRELWQRKGQCTQLYFTCKKWCHWVPFAEYCKVQLSWFMVSGNIGRGLLAKGEGKAWSWVAGFPLAWNQETTLAMKEAKKWGGGKGAKNWRERGRPKDGVCGKSDLTHHK